MPMPKGIATRKLTWTCDLCRTLNRVQRVKCRSCNLTRKHLRTGKRLRSALYGRPKKKRKSQPHTPDSEVSDPDRRNTNKGEDSGGR